MKKRISSAILLAFVLFASLLISSCSSLGRMVPQKDFLEKEDFREVIEAFKNKWGANGQLSGVEITSDRAYFRVGAKDYEYSKGSFYETRNSHFSSYKDFSITDIDVSTLDKAKRAAIERAKRNTFMENTTVSRVLIQKIAVNRDDNLVSNVGKWREAVLWEILVADADGTVTFTTNADGAIVDVPETNVTPRLKFFDEAQMKKSLDEIKPLFGGRLLISSLNIQIENFSFGANDPNNPKQFNNYRYNSHEFLRADEAETFKPKPEEGVKYEDLFFDIDEVNLSLIPKLMNEALNNLQLDDGKVSGISIRKTSPPIIKKYEIEWRVEVVGSRSARGNVKFDANGKLKEVTNPS